MICGIKIREIPMTDGCESYTIDDNEMLRKEKRMLFKENKRLKKRIANLEYIAKLTKEYIKDLERFVS